MGGRMSNEEKARNLLLEAALEMQEISLHFNTTGDPDVVSEELAEKANKARASVTDAILYLTLDKKPRPVTQVIGKAVRLIGSPTTESSILSPQ